MTTSVELAVPDAAPVKLTVVADVSELRKLREQLMMLDRERYNWPVCGFIRGIDEALTQADAVWRTVTDKEAK